MLLSSEQAVHPESVAEAPPCDECGRAKKSISITVKRILPQGHVQWQEIEYYCPEHDEKPKRIQQR